MSKDKWVRRFSVDETSKHKNGFTIYKITSVLFPIQSPDTMTAVSVWKRYSDVQRLHSAMRALHSGLHLRGTFPPLPKYSYFKRFQQEVIDERAKVIKTVLEFIAEHKLLFTSTDFVNFLQSGYPEPEPSPVGTIARIRSSLQLPAEAAAPLEYRTDDDDDRSNAATAANPTHSTDETDYSSIPSIPIHCGIDIERRDSPPLGARLSPELSRNDSFESIDSIGSGDLYSEIEKITIPKHQPQVKRNVLPDLINFDAPSTSNFEDYHTMPYNSDTTSLTSHTKSEYTRSSSRVSNKSLLSLSNASNLECKTKTEDSYVFEAGYMLNLAARYEDMKEYSRAFDCYKAGIEKMLIGVQTDTDPQRRALIKEKTSKYLSYAEAMYSKHLRDADDTLPPPPPARALHCPMPLSMLRRPHAELGRYRALALLGARIILVLHRGDQTCYAMKVIQKIPNNLTEFDEYFLQNTNETRQPILPTVIPYMVPLHSYIETNNLIFLILAYAPGEKLFDYIKNYAKSLPNTPAREVNLENVFTEPKLKNTDLENENVNLQIEIKYENKDLKTNDSEMSILDKIESNVNNNKTEKLDEVSELVLNSQKLLQNVEKALSGDVLGKSDSHFDDNVQNNEASEKNIEDKTDKLKSLTIVDRREETPVLSRLSPSRGARAVLPPGALCSWGAQILTALESLHNAGVICRDLQPSNILLGDNGQIILTYFIHYPGLEMSLAKLQAKPGEVNMYIAPELYRYTYVEERDEVLERVCDFWSFGAIMYELICGVPLSHYHRSIFTSHTILQLPDGLPVEVESLLTQLLTYEPSDRLGAGADGISEIKRHPYFKNIDWEQIYDQWSVPG